jgi:salicylate hydroxylase
MLQNFLGRCGSRTQVLDALAVFEGVRKPRTTKIKHRSQEMRRIHAFSEGPLMEERDRQLREHEPFDGYPAQWADPVLQSYMWGYDVWKEADAAWARYRKGEWPGTRGGWKER